MREQKVVVVGDCTVARTTAKAVLVERQGHDDEWIPIKALADDSVRTEGGTGLLMVWEWYALLKKWPGYEQGLPERKNGGAYTPERSSGSLGDRLAALERRVALLEGATPQTPHKPAQRVVMDI